MDIPASRKREFRENEIAFIREAIPASGLDPDSISLVWHPHSVNFGEVVKICPVLFDCRGLLDTPCWTVHRLTVLENPKVCSCGEIARDAVTGTYGSLKTAVAAAIAEVVRVRVMANIADASEPILKEPGPAQSAPCHSDFITQCVRPTNKPTPSVP